MSASGIITTLYKPKQRNTAKRIEKKSTKEFKENRKSELGEDRKRRKERNSEKMVNIESKI